MTAEDGIDPTNADTWPEILTVAQAARLLGIGPTSARRQIAAGEIEAVKFGDQWRVPKRWLVEKFKLRQGVSGRADS